MKNATKTLALAFVAALAFPAPAALTIRASVSAHDDSSMLAPAFPAIALTARARAARHFGMDEAAFDAFREGLRPGKLAQGGDYTVYSTEADGTETPRVETLPKGEAVLLDGAGTPVMLAEGERPILAVALLPDPSDPTTDPAAAPRTATGGGSPLLALLAPAVAFGGMTLSNPGGSRSSFNPVPEPASLVALGVGAAGLLRRRARKAR